MTTETGEVEEELEPDDDAIELAVLHASAKRDAQGRRRRPLRSFRRLVRLPRGAAPSFVQVAGLGSTVVAGFVVARALGFATLGVELVVIGYLWELKSSAR